MSVTSAPLPGPGARILIVEDEILVAKDIALTLRSFGHAVCAMAVSGADAVRKAAAERPDLILMDIHLRGEMSGLDAAREIRTARDVPIVFLTAFADQPTIDRARDVDAYGYVLKPFNERELQVAITIALAKHGVLRGLDKEVRQQTEALGRSEEQFRLLVESVEDYAIFMIDGAGHVASWNAGAERITGWSAGEIVRRPAALLHVPEDVAAGKPAADLLAAAATGRFEEQSWRARADGTRFFAQVVTTALRGPSGELVGFATVVADLTLRRRHEEEMAAAAVRLRALAARVDTVAEEQKTSLAREIHDVLGQELTGLKMDTAWLARRLARTGLGDEMAAPLLERLHAMAGQIDGSIQTIRRIARGLRPRLLDDLGLLAAVEWQAREFESRSGLEVEVSLPVDAFAVEPERATAVFRILQEMLTNVARHAAAHRVAIRVARLGGALVLEVADDGRGITESDAGKLSALGILGMRERSAALGGEIELSGAPGQGTRAILRMPLERS